MHCTQNTENTQHMLPLGLTFEQKVQYVLQEARAGKNDEYDEQTRSYKLPYTYMAIHQALVKNETHETHESAGALRKAEPWKAPAPRPVSRQEYRYNFEWYLIPNAPST